VIALILYSYIISSSLARQYNILALVALVAFSFSTIGNSQGIILSPAAAETEEESTTVTNSGPSSAAGHLSCGSTITKSTTLTADVGPCINNTVGVTIDVDNITLNCNEHSIISHGKNVNANNNSSTYRAVGIVLANHSGVTISNCMTIGFNSGGIYLQNATRNIVTNNTAAYGGGFIVVNSSNNTLANNAAINSSLGFELSHANNNTLTGNSAAKNNGTGFYLVYSDGVTLTKNNAIENKAAGFGLSHAIGNNLTDNIAFANQKDGLEAFSFSNNNTLSRNNVTKNMQDGISLDVFSSNNLMQQNKADFNGYYGIEDNTTKAMPITIASAITGLSTISPTTNTSNTYNENECHGNHLGNSKPSGLCASYIGNHDIKRIDGNNR
jgi:parallel beta-helix repeat protein